MKPNPSSSASDSFKGVLTEADGRCFLHGDEREHFLEDEAIWDGYRCHWLGRRVCARYLPQCDYETGKPIVIIRPDLPPSAHESVELYYNERLVKYPASRLGHLAINVNGEIFNFSHLMYENEILTEEEYLHRPAMGEFAPDPLTGRANVSRSGRPYYDRFGRVFMRTIHVLRIEGLEMGRLAAIFRRELATIRGTPVDPQRPEKYRDFHHLRRNCATIIRDGLQEYGFPSIRGCLPRDLFVNAAYCFMVTKKNPGLQAELYKKAQLKVKEAPFSKLSPILNPRNRCRASRLPSY
ncbi:MAG: hypothetical protein NTW21_17110 [Verrucomicrobia bacterium]|nr:hypothetical protein [Verrucomicrobiota bacterium]